MVITRKAEEVNALLTSPAGQVHIELTAAELRLAADEYGLQCRLEDARAQIMYFFFDDRDYTPSDEELVTASAKHGFNLALALKDGLVEKVAAEYERKAGGNSAENDTYDYVIDSFVREAPSQYPYQGVAS